MKVRDLLELHWFEPVVIKRCKYRILREIVGEQIRLKCADASSKLALCSFGMGGLSLNGFS